MPDPRKLRVAAVVDEFTRVCLEPEVELVDLDARTWRFQLAMFKPDLLFVESAWRGRRGSWQYRIARYDDRDEDDMLKRLVRHCQKKGIPTAFWAKEDPVLYDRFVHAAALFDFVFTTDEARVPAYESQCGKRPGTVHPLMFAAQPKLHYPSMAARTDTVCFAGSYGEPEFPERRAALDALLDAAADFDLVIFDRNSKQKNSHKAFPDRFAQFCRPALGYRRLADEYRRHKVFLNVNSVADSNTMFARRVFELLASGACIVSSPSTGMQHLFGDLIPIATTPDEARAAIRRFLEDDAYRTATAQTGVQRIAAAHTYAHRIAELREALEI